MSVIVYEIIFHLLSVVAPASVNALRFFAVEGAVVLGDLLHVTRFFNEDACGGCVIRPQ